MKRNIDYYSEHTTHHPYASFAFDDVLQTKVSNDGVVKVRAWVHHPFVILGLHDARLPYLKNGLKHLESLGYDYIVRNSGGLGVVLDNGVLNMSLIIPAEMASSIDAGYDMMYQWVKHAFNDFNVNIDAYEIKDSYCPGDFDLSIHGKKFAGISQRRIKGGVAVQIYLCVTGDGQMRARVMRDFYTHAKKGAITKFQYPKVDPTVMASLEDLLQVSGQLTIEDVVHRMKKSLNQVIPHDTMILKDSEVNDPTFKEAFKQQMERMMKRNRDIRSHKDEAFKNIVKT